MGKMAATGFAALSDLDTVHLVNGVFVSVGDGVFDTNDVLYVDLRI